MRKLKTIFKKSVMPLAIVALAIIALAVVRGLKLYAMRVKENHPAWDRQADNRLTLIWRELKNIFDLDPTHNI